MAYRIGRCPNLSAVHNIFHVSILRKYTLDPWNVLTHETLFLRDDLTYKEDPVQIIDRKVKRLRNKEITLVKVQWKNHRVEEATWETEGK